MTYTEKTEKYNDRRYGKPWMAVVSISLTKNFSFLDWEGRPGHAGAFSFDAEPGTILAYGQKDFRKGGGVDGYQICMPDGSLPEVGDMAVELRKMSLEARWRKMAAHFLVAAVNPPADSWRMEDWAKTRNEKSARYSAMLGVPDPVLVQVADALGLGDHDDAANPAPAAEISMDAFGF